MNYLKRAWAEINLNAVDHNWKSIKKAAGKRMIIPVIKDDGYGLGAKILVKYYSDNGASAFAVSNIEEAVKLRKYGIDRDIIVLGYTPVEVTPELARYNISQAVYSEDYWKILSESAGKNGIKIKVHIKLDTGMGRIGFECYDNPSCDIAINTITELCSSNNLIVEGIFTHFSVADSKYDGDIEYSNHQKEMFIYTVGKLKNIINFKYIHCCNSAATALMDANLGNAIRPGIILYGISPDAELDTGLSLIPAISLRASVSMIKSVKKGCTISYGRTYTAEKSIDVATVAIGYADGYPRSLSNKGRVLIHGHFANIIGRICMDQLMIDVSNIPNIHIGDTVTLIGGDGDNYLSIDEIAGLSGTISYEIMTGISQKVPRVYIDNGNVMAIEHLGGCI